MNWTRILLGAICGVVATGPMTVAMVLWHRRLPLRDKYPLPPREIAGVVLERAGLAGSSAEKDAAALVAHFAYGGAAGGLYGMIPAARLREPVHAGVMVGLLVWSLSYFGLLPALGILRSATGHPIRRNALMLGAHFVWGTCLCALHRLLLDDAARAMPALRERISPARDTESCDF
jgi:putative membrane protein